MAFTHVNSANGSPASPFDTWATAANTLAAAAAVMVAGDTMYVHPSHQETGTISFTMPGTIANPCKILCGTPDTGAGITALQTGARVIANASSSIPGFYYVYGIHFVNSTSGTVNWTFGSGSANVAYFDNCSFLFEGTGASSACIFGANTAGAGLFTLRNPTFRLGNAGQTLRSYNRTHVMGGNILSGSTSPNYLWYVSSPSSGGPLYIDGFDFSNLGTAFDLINDVGQASVVRIRNVKMPSGWVGALTEAELLPGSRVELLNYGDGDTNYKFWVETQQGIVKDETTIKRTSGGASDGTTAYSMRMTTLAGVAFPSAVLRSPPILQRVASIGAAMTATVEIVHDGASAFNEKQIWLELEYLGTSGFPVGNHVSDSVDIIASAAAQASSSEAWDGDTGTGPNGSGTWHTLKLQVTFTPQEIGYVVGTVCMGVASQTAFVDPKLAITAV